MAETPRQADKKRPNINDLLSLGDDELISESDVAHALDKTVGTLRAWASRRRGPPRTCIGRDVWYRAGSFRRWVRERERNFSTSTAA